jgi:hypothetical protein
VTPRASEPAWEFLPARGHLSDVTGLTRHSASRRPTLGREAKKSPYQHLCHKCQRNLLPDRLAKEFPWLGCEPFTCISLHIGCHLAGPQNDILAHRGVLQEDRSDRPYRLDVRFSPTSPSLSVMPSIDVARCRPSARCGVTGLEFAAGRGARRCCERRARSPLARSSLTWRALCGMTGRAAAISRQLIAVQRLGPRRPWRAQVKHN